MDEKMNVYQEIYEWMERLVETKHRANTGRLYREADTLSTYCDIRVSVLSSHNNVSRVLKYVNAMPSSLGNITFASTQEGQYITFPVSFKFDYFELL